MLTRTLGFVEGMVVSMQESLYARIYKWGLVVISVVIGVGLVWRGNTHNDPAGATVFVPMMCAVAAVFVLLTGLSIAFRENEEPATR